VDNCRWDYSRPPVSSDQQGRRAWGDDMCPKVLWDVVRAAAARAGIEKLAPHDLRRTCARLCHLAGGELDQIQFLLGHVSIQTTERYLGCKQKLRIAVNDRLGIEPDAAWRGPPPGRMLQSALADYSEAITAAAFGRLWQLLFGTQPSRIIAVH
jgi:integrase